MAKQLSIPASFAPELSDDILATYRTAIDAMEHSALKATLNKMYDFVDAWWHIPEEGTRVLNTALIEHRNDVTEDRTQVKVPIFDLPTHVKDALANVAMWEHEIEAAEKLISDIEADAVAYNEPKLEDWRTTLRAVEGAKVFTPNEQAFVYGGVGNMIRAIMAALSKFGPHADPYIDPILAAFGHSRQSIATIKKKRKELDSTLVKMEKGEIPPSVVKPELKSMAIRNMAFTLLWYVKELTNGREPLTMSKLKVTS